MNLDFQPQGCPFGAWAAITDWFTVGFYFALYCELKDPRGWIHNVNALRLKRSVLICISRGSGPVGTNSATQLILLLEAVIGRDAMRSGSSFSVT